MPVNRTYDVFLLEYGTKLCLISQSIINPQPTLKVTHDTQLFMTKTIAKTLDKTCQDIAISDQMDCIMNKIEKDLISKGIPCLPLYYWNAFPRLHGELLQCKDDSALATYNVSHIHFVRNISA